MKSLRKLLWKHHSNDYNLIGAIEEIIEAKANLTRRKEFSPYHWLPDVSSVRIEVSIWSKLFEAFGLRKRLTPSKMHYVRYKNEHLNRYLLRQIRRMREADDEKFWRIANQVISRSNVFFLVALKHVLPKWHRDLPFWKVIKLHKQYKKIVELKPPKPKTTLEVYNQYVKAPILKENEASKHLSHQERVKLTKEGKWAKLQELKKLGDDMMRMQLEVEARSKLRGGRKQDLIRVGIPGSEELLNLGINDVRTEMLKESVASIKTKLMKEDSHKYIDFKRVYILKNDKVSWRGLGVPTLVWRLYLHQLNQVLVLRFDKTIREEQHGFRPFRGTLTAWLDILKSMNNFRYIYEIDYKGFFPNLDVKVISEVFREHKVPENWILLLENLNRSLPKLPETHKADETVILRQKEWEDRYGGLKMNQNRSYWTEDQRKKYHPQIGVPQGAPTSPFISIMVLNWAIGETKLGKWIRYADDALWLSDYDIIPIQTERMKRANIQFAENKCGWVKRDGIWLKPLKFLGIIYNGITNELRADTRNGSTLVYDKDSLLEAINEGYVKDYREDMNSQYSWENFIKSSVNGYIFARLYTGTWNLENYYQNFKLTYKRGSWVETYLKWVSEKGKLGKELSIKLNVFNSSSICIVSALEALKEASRNNYRISKVKLRKSVITKIEITNKVSKEKRTVTNWLGTLEIIKEIKRLASWLG